jgi:hypothetical protein
MAIARPVPCRPRTASSSAAVNRFLRHDPQPSTLAIVTPRSPRTRPNRRPFTTAPRKWQKASAAPHQRWRRQSKPRILCLGTRRWQKHPLEMNGTDLWLRPGILPSRILWHALRHDIPRSMPPLLPRAGVRQRGPPLLLRQSRPSRPRRLCHGSALVQSEQLPIFVTRLGERHCQHPPTATRDFLAQPRQRSSRCQCCGG